MLGSLVLGLALAASAGESHLTIQKRQIDPARLVVVHLSGNGDLELLELASKGGEVLDVRAARLPGAGRWIARLELAGFFDWPESSLAAPPDVDVESDPLRVELRHGDRARLLATQAPYAPPVLLAAADSLVDLGRRGERIDSCLVCVPARARAPIPRSIADSDSVDGLREVTDALGGPFPVVLPAARGERLLRRLGPRFAVRTPGGTFEIDCKKWSRREKG